MVCFGQEVDGSLKKSFAFEFHVTIQSMLRSSAVSSFQVSWLSCRWVGQNHVTTQQAWTRSPDAGVFHGHRFSRSIYELREAIQVLLRHSQGCLHGKSTVSSNIYILVSMTRIHWPLEKDNKSCNICMPLSSLCGGRAINSGGDKKNLVIYKLRVY